MKPENYLNIMHLAKSNDGFVFANSKAEELFNNLSEGEIIELNLLQNRDLKLHRAYFALLGYIYDYLPGKFQKQVKKDYFYQFLKYAQNEIKIIFEFKNGLKICEPISISFSKMDNIEFKSFVRNQLPFIYSEVIGAFYKGQIFDDIIFNIEQEFEKTFSKLN